MHRVKIQNIRYYFVVYILDKYIIKFDAVDLISLAYTVIDYQINQLSN